MGRISLLLFVRELTRDKGLGNIKKLGITCGLIRLDASLNQNASASSVNEAPDQSQLPTGSKQTIPTSPQSASRTEDS